LVVVVCFSEEGVTEGQRYKRIVDSRGNARKRNFLWLCLAAAAIC
jgi:hypothetical protein